MICNGLAFVTYIRFKRLGFRDQVNPFLPLLILRGTLETSLPGVCLPLSS